MKHNLYSGIALALAALAFTHGAWAATTPTVAADGADRVWQGPTPFTPVAH